MEPSSSDDIDGKRTYLKMPSFVLTENKEKIGNDQFSFLKQLVVWEITSLFILKNSPNPTPTLHIELLISAIKIMCKINVKKKFRYSMASKITPSCD